MTSDKNRSYKEMKYTEKLQKYSEYNILAQAFNPITCHNNPQFLSNVVNRYDFTSIDHLKKKAFLIVQRSISKWQVTFGIRQTLRLSQVDGLMKKKKSSLRMSKGRNTRLDMQSAVDLMH